MAHKYGNTWWGAQWLKALENVDDGNRLPRGMSYARAGRVISISLTDDPVGVEALVSGSSYYPYSVSMSLSTVPEQQKKKLVDAVAADADILAAMQDGELPEELAALAKSLGIELFPSSWRSMEVDCTCPDWSGICKHAAAVFYVLADLIDTDPYLLFLMHGINLKALLAERGIHLDAMTAVRAISPVELLSREADLIKRQGAGDKPGKGGQEAALAALRSIPYSELQDLGDVIGALFPRKIPMSSAPDASALPKKLIARASKEAGRMIQRRPEDAKAAEPGEEDVTAGELEGWTSMLSHVLTTTPTRLPAGLKVKISATRPLVRLEEGGLDLGCGIELLPEGRARKHRFLHDDKAAFYEDLLRISAQEARRLRPECECWREIALAAAHILKSRAIVPAVIGDAEDRRAPRIWWAPALRDKAVCRVAARLAEGIAPWADSLVQLPKGVEPTPERVAAAGLCSAISGLMLNAVLSWTSFKKPADFYEAAIEGLDVSVLDAAVPKGIGQSLARSLRAFSMGEAYPWQPVLTVRRTVADHASVNFGILPRGERPAEEEGAPDGRQAASRPVLLRQILSDPERMNDRLAVLSILKTLGRECPVVENVRKGKGRPAKLPYGELKEFLFDMAPKLSLLGVTLMLPQSMKKLLRPVAKGFATAGKGFAKGFFSKDAIGEFSWRASLGGKDLTEAEFEKLLAHAGEVIPWGEDFVYIDPDELARIQKLVTESRKMTPLEKVRAVLSEDVEGAPIEVAPELRDALLGLTEVPDVPPPDGLKAQLRPYQERGYSWLMKNAKLGLGSWIADDMGLGKTLQVIAAILAMKEGGGLRKGKALAVLPTTLIENWRRELAKFAPGLTFGIYHGSGRQLPAGDGLPDVTLTSYGTLRRDFEALSALKWRLLVLDEAQAIKNPGSAQTVAVRGIKADQVIAMTGTPVENRLMEFWSILSAVQPRILGTRTDFERTFAAPIEGDHDPQAALAFKRLTRPFMLRRLKSDKAIISDLPEKNTIDQFVSMRPEQAALYKKTLDALLKKVEKAEQAEKAAEPSAASRMARRGAVLKLITALKQICNSPSQYEKKLAQKPDSGKGDALLEILKECREAGRKALVFTQYREMGERLQDWIERATGERPDFLHGGVTAKGRADMVDRFQQDRTVSVMIISLKAGGVGLNLTAASVVIHYDLWWNPAVEAQATDRAYRIGQRRDVAVYRFITAGSFEEKINEMLESKRNLAEMTVSAGESWIGDLPASELKRIFALG